MSHSADYVNSQIRICKARLARFGVEYQPAPDKVGACQDELQAWLEIWEQLDDLGMIPNLGQRGAKQCLTY